MVSLHLLSNFDFNGRLNVVKCSSLVLIELIKSKKYVYVHKIFFSKALENMNELKINKLSFTERINKP